MVATLDVSMAINPSFEDLYDELTGEVISAIYPSTKDHLREWFEALDGEPTVAAIIQKLQTGLDIQQWWLVNYEANNTRQDLMWPNDADQALGMRILVLRQLAESREDIGRFGFHVFHKGNGMPENAGAVVEKVFAPTARQLLRYLKRYAT